VDHQWEMITFDLLGMYHVSILEKELVFLLEEDIQQEGFSNLWKNKMSCKDQALSSSLHFEGFDVNEEINNMMDGTPEDKFDGYRCKISDDAISDGTLRRASFDSMSEGTNEEGNGE
jgi:hypothetical protein